MADGDFLAMLDALDERITTRTPEAIELGLEHVRSVVTPLVPLETGDLAGSGAITVVGDEGELLYPGPYARNQHYTLSFNHTHGQALYLEQPMITEPPAVFKIMANALGSAF